MFYFNEFLRLFAWEGVLFNDFRILVVLRDAITMLARWLTVLPVGKGGGGRCQCCWLGRFLFCVRGSFFALWGATCGTKMVGGMDGMTGIDPGAVTTTVPTGAASGEDNAVPDVIIATTVGAKHAHSAMSSVVTMCNFAPMQD